MNPNGYEECPGCGPRLPAGGPYDGRYHASAACWAIYGDLTAYTLTLPDPTFPHQYLVDTYAAQHVGPAVRPIGVAFALIGLYLAVERGMTGRQVQHLHMLLANRSKIWPAFTPPAEMRVLTVQDVLRAPPGAERDAMLRQWSASVWAAWDREHERVRALFARVMFARVRED